MRAARSQPPAQVVYRRIPPGKWDDSGKPKVGNFLLREGIDLGLSMYDVQRPRRVLEALLTSQQRKLDQATDLGVQDRLQRWFARNGRTPEELLATGWGVVELPVPPLIGWGFILGSPYAEGHLEIQGSPELFDVRAADMRELARTLTETECLR